MLIIVVDFFITDYMSHSSIHHLRAQVASRVGIGLNEPASQ